MKTGIFAYAWDLDAEGHDLALGRIAGAGFNAVNLACAYHAGKFLLPHNPRHRVYFPEDGAIYFQPDSARYGRIQPRVSSLVTDGRDPLRDLDRERKSHGLDLVAWTVCLHNTWIGERFPDCTLHNAFGDPLLHSLSPAHPDVREYMNALVADIVSSAEVSAIKLESPDYMGYTHGFHHEITPVPPDPSGTQDRLLGLSFNPVEIERAGQEGIDAERLRSQVANALDALWNDPGKYQASIDELHNNPDYGDYLQLLSRLEAELLTGVCQSIKQASPTTEIRLFAGMAASKAEVSIPAHVAELADGMLTGYVASGDAASQRVTELRAIMGDRPLYGMVRAIMPDTVKPEDAADRIKVWKENGVEGIDVYNYGFMTLPTLEAVGNTLRD